MLALKAISTCVCCSCRVSVARPLRRAYTWYFRYPQYGSDSVRGYFLTGMHAWPGRFRVAEWAVFFYWRGPCPPPLTLRSPSLNLVRGLSYHGYEVWLFSDICWGENCEERYKRDWVQHDNGTERQHYDARQHSGRGYTRFTQTTSEKNS